MLLDAEDSQLVLVDYQARLMPAIHEGNLVLANALRLVRLAHLMEVPAWGTEENPVALGENPPELRALCRKTLAKMHFSAVADGLADLLRPPARQQQGGNARSLPRHLQKPQPQAAEGRNTVVIAGCEAHVCLLQTSLDLLDEEFDV
jgi:nicotinamidase-related amidase